MLAVRVGTHGGPEAAARVARYAALETARAGAPVLLAHTLDDQAETVLLGLGRGSGARSIAGMRACDPPWYRPLLEVRRDVTHAVCAELGLRAWDDPHNTDRRFTWCGCASRCCRCWRMPSAAVAEALARTAAALRVDNDVLDGLAAEQLRAARSGESGDGLDVTALCDLPAALRRRVLRAWLLDGGAGGLTEVQIRMVDALVTDWRGQGGAAVGSDMPRTRLFAERRDTTLRLRSEPV